MTRRTALQFVAVLFAALKGERIVDQRPTPTIGFMDPDLKPSALRLYLAPGTRLEVSFGGEVIEIPQAELIAALKERP